MKKQLQVFNQKIEYQIKRSKRARSVRIAVYRDTRIVVTIPNFVGEKIIEEYLRAKADWLLNKINHFQNNKGITITSSKKDYLKNKEQARTYIISRLQYFNTNYNFEYNRVSIKNQKTRWGSCSMKKNLNFNYKILYLPPEMADYIIVHELCHLQEQNHSKDFWRLVELTIPDYRNIRKKLKNEIVSI